MDAKAISFFSNRNLHPHKLVTRGSSLGYSDNQILSAMDHCYRKISDGKTVHDIDLARYVFNVAKDGICENFNHLLNTENQASDKISEKLAIVEKNLDLALIENKEMHSGLLLITAIANSRKRLLSYAIGFATIEFCLFLIYEALK
jgi:hypothetical protein